METRKFDGKNFTLWKEMMQYVLIIQHQIEAIRHNKKSIEMSIGEWITQRNCDIEHENAPDQKCLIQYGQGNDDIYPMGKTSLDIREEVKLLQTHLYSVVV